MSKEGRAEMSSSSIREKNKEENAKLDNKSPFYFHFCRLAMKKKV